MITSASFFWYNNLETSKPFQRWKQKLLLCPLSLTKCIFPTNKITTKIPLIFCLKNYLNSSSLSTLDIYQAYLCYILYISEVVAKNWRFLKISLKSMIFEILANLKIFEIFVKIEDFWNFCQNWRFLKICLKRKIFENLLEKEDFWKFGQNWRFFKFW